MHDHPLLTKLRACEPARTFASQFLTLQDAWDTCDRPAWLLWFAGRQCVPTASIARIACECARLALHHTKDPRVLRCIEATEAFLDGKADRFEVYYADDAARAAEAAEAAAYHAEAARAAAVKKERNWQERHLLKLLKSGDVKRAKKRRK